MRRGSFRFICSAFCIEIRDRRLVAPWASRRDRVNFLRRSVCEFVVLDLLLPRACKVFALHEAKDYKQCPSPRLG